ncbi:hypothetical protein V6C03_02805 [Methyloligella sp. 2.7D]|uniref:hypothetical protein n=1 Tax=unclassified Methyloligella TaxID=2625955 RepID=UPI00157C12B0|nr:hypothetical protein [Methyloligella sp. GL2]QKP76447.1 hypothetical protein HT051_02615 [Methyloligella sp. GL2]
MAAASQGGAKLPAVETVAFAAPGGSLLQSSALVRLGIALCAIALLWAGVLWALS